MMYVFSQQGIDTLKEAKLGTLLTLSNGRIAWRGEHELYRSGYGLFLSNIYDYTPVFYRELVVFPRPVNLEIYIDGEPLDIYGRDTRIDRILDISTGSLLSRIWWRGKSHSALYESTRFVHRRRKEIIGFKARLSSSKGSRLIIRNTIDLRLSNPLIPSNISIKHYDVVSKNDLGNGISILFKTTDDKYKVAMATSLQVKPDSRRYYFSNNHYIGEQYAIEKNEDDIILEGYSCIIRNIDYEDPLEKAIECLEEAVSIGLEKLYNEHSRECGRATEEIAQPGLYQLLLETALCAL